MVSTRQCSFLRANPGLRLSLFFFFFNDTATTEIYTLSLHDALPISMDAGLEIIPVLNKIDLPGAEPERRRSEEHTSELQSHSDLVCRLLLEKKKDLQSRTVWLPRQRRERSAPVPVTPLLVLYRHQRL